MSKHLLVAVAYRHISEPIDNAYSLISGLHVLIDMIQAQN